LSVRAREHARTCQADDEHPGAGVTEAGNRPSPIALAREPRNPFAGDPLSWLQAISRYSASYSGGPNFAYQLCADRLPATRQADLDLSSWRFAYCGAEPVRRSTLEQFASAFATYGFSPNRFYPCFGLAESTLAVTLDRPAGEPRFLSVSTRGLQAGRIEAADSRLEMDIIDLVSCGLSSPGHHFVIVDPETCVERGEGEIGEIWASGPSVSAGYWQHPEATAAVFGKYLATGQGPFLRTGDLGFVDEGQLYITGRLKDLIILRGRNHYPQDIEATTTKEKGE
jgi:acyl-CoA synthetase (AMP-forming)/AMP-acid ligase II